MKEKVVISGREITQKDIDTVIFIVDNFGNLSRKELANTVCECLDWITLADKPKVEAGVKLLEYLESNGEIILPPKNEKMACQLSN
jgi:hypothetical protein